MVVGFRHFVCLKHWLIDPNFFFYKFFDTPFIDSNPIVFVLGLNSLVRDIGERERDNRREFVPRDQVFPLIVVYCLLPLLKK